LKELEMKKNYILLIIVLIILLFYGCAATKASLKTEKKNPTISGVFAINYFKDVSDEKSNMDITWISRSFADFLISELTQYDFLQLVSRNEMEEIIQEQKLSLTGMTDKELEIGKVLSADYILSGDYYIKDKKITVNVKLINSETGQIIHATRLEESAINLYAAQQRILWDLLQYFNVEVDFTSLAVKDYETDAKSIKLYYEAEELMQLGKEKEAAELLKELLSNNKYFTPAVEEIKTLSSSDNKRFIGGDKVLESIDEENRKRIYYRNLFDSFINYTEENAYKAIITY
jgi:TolB-like protein